MESLRFAPLLAQESSAPQGLCSPFIGQNARLLARQRYFLLEVGTSFVASEADRWADEASMCSFLGESDMTRCRSCFELRVQRTELSILHRARCL